MVITNETDDGARKLCVLSDGGEEIMVLLEPTMYIVAEEGSDEYILVYNDNTKIIKGPAVLYGDLSDGRSFVLLPESVYESGNFGPPDMGDGFLEDMLD